MKKPIVIDNILPDREFESLYEYFDRRSPLSIWTLNNSSLGRGDPVSWKHPLKDDLIFLKCAATIRLKMMKHLKKDIKLCKIHTNGQTPGQNALFHIDFQSDNVWTFIYFNQSYWDIEWGGEFVSKSPDGEVFYTPYKSNTGVFIPSNWEHKGNSPNSLIGNGYRTTIAFSYCIPEIYKQTNPKGDVFYTPYK